MRTCIYTYIILRIVRCSSIKNIVRRTNERIERALRPISGLLTRFVCFVTLVLRKMSATRKRAIFNLTRCFGRRRVPIQIQIRVIGKTIIIRSSKIERIRRITSTNVRENVNRANVFSGKPLLSRGKKKASRVSRVYITRIDNRSISRTHTQTRNLSTRFCNTRPNNLPKRRDDEHDEIFDDDTRVVYFISRIRFSRCDDFRLGRWCIVTFRYLRTRSKFRNAFRLPARALR